MLYVIARCALIVVALLAATFVSMQRAQAQAGEKLYDYVSVVNIWHDGFLRISVPGRFDALHGCPDSNFGVSSHPLDSVKTKAFLEIAVASFLSHSKVYIWTVGCDPGGQPIIMMMQLTE